MATQPTSRNPGAKSKQRRWILWTMGSIFALGLLLMLVGGAWLWRGWTKKVGPELDRALSAPRLEAHYSGFLNWGGQSLPITWQDSGTLDNDGDHTVVLIRGKGVSLRAVWGWVDSGLSLIGTTAKVDQAQLPEGWPTPHTLRLGQLHADGGCEGKLWTDSTEIIAIKLEPRPK